MEEYMEEDNSREFVAYSRLLLRSLKRVKTAISEHDIEGAMKVIDELIEDTQSDIVS